jgi:lipopolysaccharide assembly outer membrane protein LptD (OstA)
VYNGRVGFGGSLGKNIFAYSLSAELSLSNDHIYWYSSGADYYFAAAYQHSLRIEGQMKLRPAGWFEAEANVGIYAWENYDSFYSNRPNFDFGLDLRYTGRKVTAGINLGYVSSIKWLTMGADSQMTYTQTDGTFTLGLEAEWRINERWAAFVEGRNLTGSRIYEWLNYYTDSAQGLVGFKFTF